MVQFCWIVRDGEVDLQDVAVADAAWIEGDAYRFRMASRPRLDSFIIRRRRAPAGIAGDCAGDAGDMLEHALHTPETSTGQYRHLRCGRRVGIVQHGRWDSLGRLGIRA